MQAEAALISVSGVDLHEWDGAWGLGGNLLRRGGRGNTSRQWVGKHPTAASVL